ncbi:uncharacterized protein MELLADRAFT_59067 [Melampsora larici-populina 98AG31]|uniref:Uncharacterized protein n=1 Tax=Melampsora larici-populina (strain 98AG31 / pathotype 3-4-7) TaxID=747676 RepID=F4R6Y6_MELLP|nr:uncharacterized protein MELLADRAFT_59067 [Melampsora larici-populina 98AG31]EGG12374.1 hypothetical protein MELLADRAFT_59067 [Melampsora larici-populina 98AG31]
MTFELPSSKLDINQDGDFTPYDGRSLAETSIYTSSYRSDPDFYKSTLYSPVQTARTRATSDALDRIMSTQATQLSALCNVWRSRFSLSPLVPSIPKENVPVIRTRATSDALERILACQSHQLTLLGAVWRERFPTNPLNSSNENAINDKITKSNHQDDIKFGEMIKDGSNQRDHELEQRVFEWMDNFPDYFDYTVEDIEYLDF